MSSIEFFTANQRVSTPWSYKAKPERPLEGTPGAGGWKREIKRCIAAAARFCPEKSQE